MGRYGVAVITVIGLLLSSSCAENRNLTGEAANPVARRDTPKDLVPPRQEIGVLMRAKLKHAQAVLEGIALKKFDLIEENAAALHSISVEAPLSAHRTLRYMQHSREFQQITQDLVTRARDQQLQGAAADYTRLTLTCVKCHHYMRDEGLVPIEGGVRRAAPVDEGERPGPPSAAPTAPS